MSGELFLAKYAEFTNQSAGGDDHSAGLVYVALVAGDGFHFTVEVDSSHVVPYEFSTELFGLPLHGIHEVWTHNAIREAGEVFDFRGIDQLTAGSYGTGNHQRFVSGAAEVDGRGIAGGAGSNNDNVTQITHGYYLS